MKLIENRLAGTGVMILRRQRAARGLEGGQRIPLTLFSGSICMRNSKKEQKRKKRARTISTQKKEGYTAFGAHYQKRMGKKWTPWISRMNPRHLKGAARGVDSRGLPKVYQNDRNRKEKITSALLKTTKGKKEGRSAYAGSGYSVRNEH